MPVPHPTAILSPCVTQAAQASRVDLGGSPNARTSSAPHVLPLTCAPEQDPQPGSSQERLDTLSERLQSLTARLEAEREAFWAAERETQRDAAPAPDDTDDKRAKEAAEAYRRSCNRLRGRRWSREQSLWTKLNDMVLHNETKISLVLLHDGDNIPQVYYSHPDRVWHSTLQEMVSPIGFAASKQMYSRSHSLQ